MDINEIIILGDSIGYGYKNKNTSFTYLLSNDFDVKNEAICGISAKSFLSILNNIKSLVLKKENKEHRLFIISLGTNDASFLLKENRYNVDIDEFKTSLINLVEILKDYGKSFIFLSTSKVNESKSKKLSFNPVKSSLKNDDLIKYSNVIKEVSNKNNYYYIDLFNLIDINTDLIDDGVHPNSFGHKKIYEEIINIINKD